ncbi:hypothetical protein Tco_0331778 [Tanacetum coccineum]
MTYPYHWFSEQVGLTGDLGSTNNVLIPLIQSCPDSEDSTAPPSSDYVSGAEYPPSPYFVPEPVYPEFMPPEDEILRRNLPDGGDDGMMRRSSMMTNDKDVFDIEGVREERATSSYRLLQLLLYQSVAVTSLVDPTQTPSAETTEALDRRVCATPPPHPAYRVTARISIRDEPPTPLWSYTEVAKLLAIPTPPPSPLSLWS